MTEQQPSLEEVKQQCIFCQIISGEVPSKRVFEDENFIAVLDINPASKGHMLVLTKEHYSVMPQIPENVIENLGKVAKALSRASLRAFQAQGTSIFIANGPTAGQRAQHFMMHIIPRIEDDGLGITLSEGQIQSEVQEKIQNAFLKGAEQVFGKSFEERKKENKEENSEVRVKEKNNEEEASLDDIASFLTGK